VTSRQSRHERGYGWEWEKARKRVLVRDKYLCQLCMKAKRVRVATDVDHIVPRAQGGSEADDNLQSLCGDCHKAKTAREGQTPRG
jgi:5-methylcytosine-specific restriction enzyme A